MNDQNSQFENDREFGNDTEQNGNQTIKETAQPNEEQEKEGTRSFEQSGASFSWEDARNGGGRHASYGQAQPPKRSGVPVWTLVVTLALCVILPFCGIFAGFAAARLGFFGAPDDPEQGESDTNQNGIFGNGGKEDGTEPNHLVENPEEILDKSEPNDSIYGSAGEDVFAVSGVVQRVQNAVAVIEAKITNKIFGQSTVQTSSGSGVVISADGYVLTCNHVVEGASEVKVILETGEEFDAVLVGSDAASDLAVLKVDPNGKELVFVEQGCSEDLVLGEQVVAIGNPLGTLGGTVTTGIVSATEREIQMNDGTTMTLIQTDAAINSGNSGGGLFNLDGQLIGIVNAKYSASGVEGLAFAIPIDSAYTVQLDLIEYGYVRGVVDHGLEFLEITEAMLRDFYYGHYYASRGITEAGLYVLSSEYEKTLKNADMIRSVNGTEVKTQAEFDAVIADCKVGDVLTVIVAKIEDKWAEITVELELREFVPDRLKDALK